MKVENVKLDQLKKKDILLVDNGFTCMNEGKYLVKIDKKGLYVRCIQGKHYLDGQIGDDGFLVGMKRIIQ